MSREIEGNGLSKKGHRCEEELTWLCKQDFEEI